jgi:UDP-galactopyranose mutase
MAGAAYDTPYSNYYVSEYGAHIFHTNNEHIWSFINQFSQMVPFINKPKALNGRNMYSFPINLMTLSQLYGITTPGDAERHLEKVRIPIKKGDKINFENWLLSLIGRDLYEIFYYHYTKKQWLKEPCELPSSIARRVPIRLTYEENYFITPYQGIPEYGYTNLIKTMLDGIEVRLDTDYLNHRDEYDAVARRIIYTGPIDKYYDYEYGKLDYRTMGFKKEIFKNDQQGNAVINHVGPDTDYLRSIEHHHFYNHSFRKKCYTTPSVIESVITYDYPLPMDESTEPYYPIYDNANSILLKKYQDIKNNKTVFGGRLGSYLYLDMDQSMASALALAAKLEGKEAIIDIEGMVNSII